MFPLLFNCPLDKCISFCKAYALICLSWIAWETPISTLRSKCLGDDNKERRSSPLESNDSLWLVVEEYRSASNLLRTSEASEQERMQFYSDWKERLSVAIEAANTTKYLDVANIELLGICNSLGDSQRAESILKSLIAKAASPREKLTWNSEIGEMYNARFAGRAAKADALLAIESFSDAKDEYRRLSKADQITTRDRQIINSCMMAALYSRAIKDHGRSAQIFQEVRDFHGSTAPSSAISSLGYDFEYAASSEMIEWLKAGNSIKAEAALELLAGRKDMQWPPSYYAYLFTSIRDSHGGKPTQVFLEKWLAQKPWDDWTPFLRFYLAKDYFQYNQHTLAKPIFMDLKDQHADVFLNADQEAIHVGRGGFYAEILYYLSILHRESGDQDEAKSLADEMEGLVPQDPRTSDLKKAAAVPVDGPPASFVRILIIAGNVIIVMVLCGFAVIRKRWRARGFATSVSNIARAGGSVMLVVCSAHYAVAAKPLLQFHKSSLSLGEIDQGKVATGIIAFRNVSSTSLTVAGITGSCTCTIAEFAKGEIKPNSDSKFMVSIDTNRRSGVYESEVTLQLKHLGKDVTEKVAVTVFIRAPGKLVSDPETLFLGNVVSGSKVHYSVDIRQLQYSHHATSIREVAAPKWLTVKLSTMPGSDPFWRLHVDGIIPNVSGITYENIVLTTDSERFPKMVLPIVFTVEGSFIREPRSIVKVLKTDDSAITCNVIVRHATGMVWRVDDIRTEGFGNDKIKVITADETKKAEKTFTIAAVVNKTAGSSVIKGSVLISANVQGNADIVRIPILFIRK